MDPDALKLFSYRVFSNLQGAVTAGMIHLGDALGLYRALADAGEPLDSAGLAARTGLHERWVREWVYNQAAAGIVETVTAPTSAERFTISAEAAAVLADEEHPAFGMGMFHRLPETMAALRDLPQSFRTGIGHDYDSLGAEGAISIERSFEPWNQAFVQPVVLPALDGIVERLERGIEVADVGCGAGGLVMLLAEAFPNSTFHGYDISRHALDRAEQRRVEAGLGNAVFHDASTDPLPEDGRFGLVTAFDCIHDMTHPAEVIGSIRRSLADDGTWLLVDIKALDTFAENTERNPMAALLYGISVLSCMSSALSTADGAGLGTLGLPESRARALSEEAGFTRFRRLPIEHVTNAFYEIRP